MGTRKPYPDEFKQEAVRLVTEQGFSASRVARDLGLDPETLRRWLRARAADGSTAPDSPPAAAELSRLRRANDQLRMERDMLKKAIGIFSRMPQ